MLIKNEVEFLKFYDKLYELERDEVFFLSLSARNKYLTEEERKKYALGRTEMFSREFVFDKDVEKFEKVLSKMENSLLYKTTSNGSLIPHHALIIYFNLNPTSTIKAYQHFVQEMNKELFLLLSGVEKNKNTDVYYNRFKNCQSVLNTQMQKYTSRKVFMDIDCDTKDLIIIDPILNFLKNGKVLYFVVNTKSGYHIVLRKDSFVTNGNIMQELFTKLIPEANAKAKESGGEVILNKNEMVPLCGTMQGGDHLVKIVESNY